MIAHISSDGREQNVTEHISGTAEIAEKESEKLGLSNLMWICGIYHDIGKINKAFEEYIQYSYLHNGAKNKSVPHSSSGAHYVYYDLPEIFSLDKLSKEIIAVVIASHHGVKIV